MSIAERASGGLAVRSSEAGRDLIGGLDPHTAGRLLAVACDLTIVLDSAGRVKDLAFGNEDIAAEPLRSWMGHRLVETLADDSKDKLADLLHEIKGGRQERWRHLNHVLPNGDALPVRYRGVALGTDRIVLLGRELRALAGLQQRLSLAELAMARDYQRISSAEGRYRMLFQTSSEAVLVADPAGLRVLEANPAMASLCGCKPKDLVGTPVCDLMQPASREPAETLLAAVRLTARGEDVQVRILGRPDDLSLSAMLFRQDNAVRILVRLVPAPGQALPGPAASPPRIVVVVQSMPDGFVLMGPDLRIRMANVAFLEAAQLSILEQAKGERIDRWLGRTDVDVDVMMTALRERGTVRQFATILRGEYGAREDVEVSAVLVEADGEPCIGFTLRLAGARLPMPAAAEGAVGGNLTDLVGQVPLKTLVRDTTDQVEKRCIETALQLTRGNRAAAADMLGLSRQSLYAKLRRFGLIGEDEVDDGVS